MQSTCCSAARLTLAAARAAARASPIATAAASTAIAAPHHATALHYTVCQHDIAGLATPCRVTAFTLVYTANRVVAAASATAAATAAATASSFCFAALSVIAAPFSPPPYAAATDGAKRGPQSSE